MAFAGNVMIEKLHLSNMYYCFFQKKKRKMKSALFFYKSMLVEWWRSQRVSIPFSWGYAWFGWISKLIVWCVVKEAISPICWYFSLTSLQGCSQDFFQRYAQFSKSLCSPSHPPPPKKKLPWLKIWLCCKRLRVFFLHTKWQ